MRATEMGGEGQASAPARNMGVRVIAKGRPPAPRQAREPPVTTGARNGARPCSAHDATATRLRLRIDVANLQKGPWWITRNGPLLSPGNNGGGYVFGNLRGSFGKRQGDGECTITAVKVRVFGGSWHDERSATTARNARRKTSAQKKKKKNPAPTRSESRGSERAEPPRKRSS